MPHLLFELSDNIIEKNQLLPLFEQCHRLLAEKLPTKIESCKSRTLVHSQYMIGDGRPENAFVHLDLRIMAGRTPEVLNEVGEHLMALLLTYFNASSQKWNLQITLEISNLNTYFKMVSGELKIKSVK